MEAQLCNASSSAEFGFFSRLLIRRHKDELDVILISHEEQAMHDKESAFWDTVEPVYSGHVRFHLNLNDREVNLPVSARARAAAP